ncbi:MAG: RHS repeat-associated core domain-containing protein [Chlamydiia bacterium]|nr:RHS repeat-associated core domain-containing protein [Chlamydiia bacterium]
MISWIKRVFFTVAVSSFYSFGCFGITAPKFSSENIDLTTGAFVDHCPEVQVSGPLPFTLVRAQGDEGYPFCNGWSLRVEAPEATLKSGGLKLMKETDDAGRLIRVSVVSPTKTLFNWARIDYGQNEIAITLNDGRSFRYALAGDGSLQEVQGPDGQIFKYTYQEGRVTRKTSSWGMDLTNVLCPETGRVIAQKALIERGSEPVTIAEYQYEEGRTTVTTPWGLKTVTSFNGAETLVETYDGATLIRSESFLEGPEARHEIRDANGTLLKTHTRRLNESGKVCEETFSGEGVTYSRTFTYTAEGLLASEVDSEGNSSTYIYDAEGLLVEETNGEGRRTFHYDDGLLVETNFQGHSLKITPSTAPHSAGLPQLIEEYEEGKLLSARLLDYAHSGLISERIDYDLVAETAFWSHREFDGAGREIYRSDSAGNSIATLFNDERGVITEMDQNSGEVAESEINILGKVTHKLLRRLGEGDLEQAHTYDCRGKLLRSKDTLGAITDFSYDALGRLTVKTGPEVLDAEDRLYRPVTRYVYDALDRAIETIDPEGNLIRAGYRFHSKPILLEYADGTKEEMHYDGAGNLKGRTDRRGIASTPISPAGEAAPAVEKDEILSHYSVEGGLLKQTTFFKTGLELVSYIDPLGRIQSVDAHGPNSKILFHKELRYNGNGQMTLERVDVYTDGVFERSQTTLWEYGAGGQLVQKTESGKVTTFTQNERGLTETVHRPDGVLLSYSYDDMGNLAALSSSDGSVSYEYAYDSEGRLIEALDRLTGRIVTRSYTEEGKLASEEFGSGLHISHSYDADGVRTETTLPDGSKVLFGEGKLLRLSAEGKLLYSDSKGILPGKTGTIKVDKTSIEAPGFSQTLQITNGTLKRVDEKVGKKSKSLNLKYDCLGQLVSDGEKTYRYSGIGEKIEEPANETTHLCEYDALERLQAVITEEFEVRYAYDGLMRRASRTVIERESGNVVEEQLYLYDDKKEIGSLEEGRLTALCLQSPELPGRFILEKEEKTYCCVQDLRGSVRAVYDIASGEQVETYDYTSFGESEKKEGICPWRFAGKRLDDKTGLIDFGRRDYNPKAGRWLTRDPAGALDSICPYAFAQNDPWGKTDPNGLFSISSWSHSLSDWYNRFNPLSSLRTHLENLGSKLLGPRYLKLWLGWNAEPSHTGIYGTGELNDRYRITFINGILTDKQTLLENVDLISQSHGGCNVHYCYVGTRGWANDLVRALYSKLGFVSPEAQVLAETWKRLIRELGGPQSGSIIFHYAHSQGGTETLRARYLLTPEEQRMISVITLGSPTLIPDDGTFHSVINIISCRDIISLFSPVEFFYSIIVGGTNVIFVGSHWDGWPVIDHPFNNYWNHFTNSLWQEFEFLFK